jgi:hypothetical protein
MKSLINWACEEWELWGIIDVGGVTILGVRMVDYRCGNGGSRDGGDANF